MTNTKPETKRAWLDRRKAAEKAGPLAVKRCRCEHPFTTTDELGTRCTKCAKWIELAPLEQITGYRR